MARLSDSIPAIYVAGPKDIGIVDFFFARKVILFDIVVPGVQPTSATIGETRFGKTFVQLLLY